MTRRPEGQAKLLLANVDQIAGEGLKGLQSSSATTVFGSVVCR